MLKLSGQGMAKIDPNEGKLKKHDNWNAKGDFGLVPGHERFLLHGIVKTMSDIWISFLNNVTAMRKVGWDKEWKEWKKKPFRRL